MMQVEPRMVTWLYTWSTIDNMQLRSTEIVSFLTVVYTTFPVDVTNTTDDEWMVPYDAGHMTTRPCSTETVSSPDYRVTTMVWCYRETGTEHHVDVCTVQSADYYLVMMCRTRQNSHRLAHIGSAIYSTSLKQCQNWRKNYSSDDQECAGVLRSKRHTFEL